MVTVRAAGAALDPTRIVLPLELTHGRSGIAAQPDAPSCAFTWDGPTFPATLGDPLTVDDDYPPRGAGTWTDPNTSWADMSISWLGGTLTSPRFAGTITGLQAVEELGRVVAWAVRATGVQAALGRIPCRLTRPQETDTARAAAILEAAGVPYRIHGTPSMTLAADSIDRDTLAALHQLAAGTGALVWQARDGTMIYGAADHRAAPPSRVLPASVILDGASWTNDLELVANHVTVSWGPEQGPRQEATYRDDVSIARWGLRHADAATLAADARDAELFALLILGRRGHPYWRQPSALVDHAHATPADTRTLLDLEVSDGVTLPIPSAPGPTPAPAVEWTVEGWVETWAPGPAGPEHLTQLAISDRRRGTAGLLRPWSAVAAQPWAHWTTGTYLEQLVEA